jgi:hypothetical protein
MFTSSLISFSDFFFQKKLYILFLILQTPYPKIYISRSTFKEGGRQKGLNAERNADLELLDNWHDWLCYQQPPGLLVLLCLSGRDTRIVGINDIRLSSCGGFHGCGFDFRTHVPILVTSIHDSLVIFLAVIWAIGSRGNGIFVTLVLEHSQRIPKVNLYLIHIQRTQQELPEFEAAVSGQPESEISLALLVALLKATFLGFFGQVQSCSCF